MKAILICNASPFKIVDGVSAALGSLLDAICNVSEEVDVYVVNTNLFYKQTNNGVIREIGSLRLNLYHVVFVSPITAMFQIQRHLSKKREFLVICQISDCMSYELWRSFVLSLKYGSINVLPLVKIPYYYFKEFQVRNISDSVLLQTARDVSIFNRLYFTLKGVALPNINLNLGSDLQYKGISNKQNSIGWCATFDGEYLKLAKWFFRNVIFVFLTNNKNVSLSLVGKNNKNFYLFLVEKFPQLKDQIIFNGYVHDMISFNASNKVVISPIFKRYGLINKTIEAMFSGVVVLGDVAAFNGIESCVSYENCIIAEKVDEFIFSLDHVFNMLSDLELDNIGSNAKRLIQKQFIMENNEKVINKLLKN